MAAVTVEELRDAAGQIRWYHSMDLGHGIVTRGSNDPRVYLKRLQLPPRLDGISVLDIGAWDGFYSFEAERRGAKRVLATDHHCWSGPGWATKAGFDLAHRALGSKVESLDIDVMDLTPERVGKFDLVLFLGVLYHLRHPLLALERVFSVTGRQLILETHVDMLFSSRPACAFYPGAELNRDDTNWFGPNPAAVIAMLRDVGFRRVETVWRPRPFPLRLAYAVGYAVMRREPFQLARPIREHRCVVHAWR